MATKLRCPNCQHVSDYLRLSGDIWKSTEHEDYGGEVVEMVADVASGLFGAPIGLAIIGAATAVRMGTGECPACLTWFQVARNVEAGSTPAPTSKPGRINLQAEHEAAFWKQFSQNPQPSQAPTDSSRGTDPLTRIAQELARENDRRMQQAAAEVQRRNDRLDKFAQDLATENNEKLLRAAREALKLK